MLRRGSEETVPHADEPLMYLLQGVAGGMISPSYSSTILKVFSGT